MPQENFNKCAKVDTANTLSSNFKNSNKNKRF